MLCVLVVHNGNCQIVSGGLRWKRGATSWEELVRCDRWHDAGSTRCVISLWRAADGVNLKMWL
jgi:hypothetical protein